MVKPLYLITENVKEMANAMENVSNISRTVTASVSEIAAGTTGIANTMEKVKDMSVRIDETADSNYKKQSQIIPDPDFIFLTALLVRTILYNSGLSPGVSDFSLLNKAVFFSVKGSPCSISEIAIIDLFVVL